MARKGKPTKGGKGALSSALARYQAIEKKSQIIKDNEQKQKEIKLEKIKNINKPKRNRYNKSTSNGDIEEKAQEGEEEEDDDIENQKPAFVPFSNDENVLLVGEGDFSFSLSIIKMGYIQPEKLIATSFDSLEGLIIKYANVEDNLKELKSKGAKVYHKIDGTNLIKSLKLVTSFKKNKNKNKEILGTDLINLIMFNFPHTGKGIKDVDRNIMIHQQLMADFFTSCSELFKLLKANRNFNSCFKTSANTASLYESGYGFEKLTTKKPNANGSTENIDRIAVSLFDGEPYDSWQVKRLARESVNYKVERSGSFNWKVFEGYYHRRTNSMRDTTKAANKRSARIYVFEKFVKLDSKKRKANSDDESDDEK